MSCCLMSSFVVFRERGGETRGVPGRLQEHDALPHQEDLPVRALRRLPSPLPQQPHTQRRSIPALGHRQGRTGKKLMPFAI